MPDSSFSSWCDRVLRESATHYEVLGLKRFEANQHRIRQATQAQYRQVWRHAKGPNAATAQRARIRIHQAAQCLADADRKAAYDQLLRHGVDPSKAPVSVSVAVAGMAGQRIEAADRELTRSLVIGSCAVMAAVALVIAVYTGSRGGAGREVVDRQGAAPDVVQTPPLEPLPPAKPPFSAIAATEEPGVRSGVTSAKKLLEFAAPKVVNTPVPDAAEPPADDPLPSIRRDEPPNAHLRRTLADLARPDDAHAGNAGNTAPTVSQQPAAPVVPHAPSILKERLAGLRSLALSPDGRRLLCGTWDMAVVLFDLETGAKLHRFEGCTESVYDVAFAPDGKHVAAALADGAIFVWDAAGGTPPKKLLGHVGVAMRITFTQHGQRLVSVGDDHTLRIWDLETGKADVQHKGDARWMALAVSASDELLTGGRDGSLVLWSATGVPQAKLKGHRAAIHSVAFVQGTRTCVSGSWDGTVRVWNLDSLAETRQLAGAGALSLAVSRDGTRLATGCEDGRVETWDLTSGRRLSRMADAHRQRVSAVAFTHGPLDVLSAGWDDAVRRFAADPAP